MLIGFWREIHKFWTSHKADGTFLYKLSFNLSAQRWR